MNLLADESIESYIVEQLRRDGHDVAYVVEMTPGVSDDEVLTRADQLGAVLLTQDKDFGELVYRLGRASNGVVLVRLPGLSEATKIKIVSSAIREHGQSMIGAFSVISKASLRIRRGGRT